MATRGPKPQPSALRILRGNPSRRAVPEEPPPDRLAVEAEEPPELAGDEAAIAEYRRLAPRLTDTGHVTRGDRAVFLAYCRAWSRYLFAVSSARGQPLTVESAQGSPYLNPAHVAADRATTAFLRAASELGLTPASRARVSRAPSGPGRSKWAGEL